MFSFASTLPGGALHCQIKRAANGWRDRSCVVVLDPELEAWIWDSSYQVDRIIDEEDLADAGKRTKMSYFFAGGPAVV
jgi:hypothetical protein